MEVKYTKRWAFYLLRRMTQHVVMIAPLMTTLWMTLRDGFVERSSSSRSVIGFAVITRSVSSVKRLNVLHQKRIVLVSQIVNGFFQCFVTIAKNIMFSQGCIADVLGHFLSFMTSFFFEGTQVV